MSESHNVYGGLIVDISEESLERVSKILKGVPGGTFKAVGSALARAGQAGRTVAARAASKEYAISQQQFNSNIRNINHFTKTSGDTVTVEFGYCGYVIPLVKFDTTVTGDGHIATRAKRASTKTILDNAFMANMGKHTGIFERETPSRFPVRELFGPAPTQMMYSSEEVMDAVEERASEVYEQRIEHEITRILNGYGG